MIEDDLSEIVFPKIALATLYQTHFTREAYIIVSLISVELNPAPLPIALTTMQGTQLYDPKAGGWRDLGMLDVIQIFGRAGRT
ncbi:hypothetical protein Vadar_013970 [Vaccinium darrowii]|uniref:Uncharacterized protein n=1 Tax=Vaccinium darrowii TaxID=229202 RepID=A0ACB7X0L7_9ERIC|nr:hypothetical protein Vadar_013970 [Vaccinium darrowii]